jgi:hypothetical protein
VERGLGKVQSFIKEMRSAAPEMLDELSILADAKLLPSDVARKRNEIWECGAFALECGALWRGVYGARQGIHGNTIAKINARRSSKKPGSFRTVKAGVLKAVGIATISKHVGRPLAAERPQSAAMLLAAADRAPNKEKSTAGTPSSPYWGKRFPRHFLAQADYVVLDYKLGNLKYPREIGISTRRIIGISPVEKFRLMACLQWRNPDNVGMD